MAKTKDKQVDFRKMEVLADEVTTSSRTAAIALVALTNSSGGTPSNTIVDVPGSYTEATLANQIASLTAKINEIIAALKA